MRRSASVRRVLLFALVPVLQGCEESEIPIEPEGDPRFTNLVIDKLDADPALDDNLEPGPVSYDVSASYQLSGGWEDEELTAFFVINSLANGAFVRTEVSETQPVNADRGTIGFEGSFTLPDCGSIDEIIVYFDLSVTSDPDVVADSDVYFVDVENTSSTPC